jgi:hypothetical protein
MDCESARLLLPYFRPGDTELDGALIAAVERHLADCPGCTAERRVDDVLSRSIRAVTPPAGLRDRLTGRLSAVRRRWWRVHVTQGVVLTAAVVFGFTLLFVGVGLAFRPTFDLSAIADTAAAQSSDEVEGWLQRIDPRLSLPPQLEYRYLQFYERVEYRGLSVPQLVFVHPDGPSARVLVLRDVQVANAGAMTDEARAENSDCVVVVLRDAANPKVFFLVIVRGGPFEKFRKARDGTL